MPKPFHLEIKLYSTFRLPQPACSGSAASAWHQEAVLGAGAQHSTTRYLWPAGIPSKVADWQDNGGLLQSMETRAWAGKVHGEYWQGREMCIPLCGVRVRGCYTMQYYKQRPTHCHWGQSATIGNGNEALNQGDEDCYWMGRGRGGNRKKQMQNILGHCTRRTRWLIMW